MIQVVTPQILEYAPFALAINASYAVKWGYDFMVYSDVDQDCHPAWGKVKAVREFMAQDYELFFVLDADAYVNNKEIPIEQFIDRESEAIMYISENGPNGGKHLNTGSMIIRNGNIGFEYINLWYKLRKDPKYQWNHFWEQEALNDVMVGPGAGSDFFRRYTKVLPYRAINSHWMDCEEGRGDPLQFVQHVMARSTEDKRLYIKSYFEKTI
jgi:hypothetical protein